MKRLPKLPIMPYNWQQRKEGSHKTHIGLDVHKKFCHTKRLVTEESPSAKLLMTIPGIGYFSAPLLAAEIGDIKRFRSYRKLCSYGGVVCTDETADKVHHGHIIKDSNKHIRWVLIEAVDKAIKKDPQLASSYLKVLRKRVN